MINLGVDLDGKDCILVVIDYNNNTFRVIDATPKIKVEDIDNQDDIKDFYTNISSFVKENHIEKIYIRQRQKKGKFAGGPTSFKLEALIQLLDNSVKLISPTAIAYAIKKINIEALVSKIHNYQTDALKVAITGTLKNDKR